MARATLNPLFESLHGRIGDFVVKQYGRRIVITRKPVFKNRVFSESQRACQERFRQAALFANTLMADPRARAFYEREARAQGKPVRSLMIADFLHARPPQQAGTPAGTGVATHTRPLMATFNHTTATAAGCSGDHVRIGRAIEERTQAVQASPHLFNTGAKNCAASIFMSHGFHRGMFLSSPAREGPSAAKCACIFPQNCDT